MNSCLLCNIFRWLWFVFFFLFFYWYGWKSFYFIFIFYISCSKTISLTTEKLNNAIFWIWIISQSHFLNILANRSFPSWYLIFIFSLSYPFSLPLSFSALRAIRPTHLPSSNIFSISQDFHKSLLKRIISLPDTSLKRAKEDRVVKENEKLRKISTETEKKKKKKISKKKWKKK